MDHFHFLKQGLQEVGDERRGWNGIETAVMTFGDAEGNMDVKTRHFPRIRIQGFEGLRVHGFEFKT
jgi:hypothetical protein